MKISPSSALITPAKHCLSPNCDDRPDTCLDLIVVHGISLPPGQFGGDNIERFFQNKLDITEHEFYAEIENVRVSSHLLIKRDGELVQFVPFNKRAWHAGVSQYQERDRCNDFSIGIELEGTDDIPYEPCQYQVLSEVIQCLCRHYPSLSTDHVVGHCHIAPGRKSDPGPSFNWPHLKGLLECDGA